MKTVFTNPFILAAIFFLLGLVFGIVLQIRASKDALDLWQGIEDICTNNDLSPFVTTNVNSQGNLVFLIKCK